MDTGRRHGSSHAWCDLAVGGHIVTLVAGPSVVPGTVVTTPLDHSSILQTIEDRFSVDRMVRTTEDLYLDLLDRKTSSTRRGVAIGLSPVPGRAARTSAYDFARLSPTERDGDAW